MLLTEFISKNLNIFVEKANIICLNRQSGITTLGDKVAFKISEEEWNRLYGLPDFPFRLYMTIRSKMDYATGLAGESVRISWASLAREMYVEPGQGRQNSGTPSKEKVRKAAQLLEKEGLIEIVSINTSSDKRLILKCALAETDYCVQNKEDIGGTHQQNINNTNKTHPLSETNQTLEESSEPKEAIPKIPKQDNISGIRNIEDHQNARTRVATFIPKTPGEWAQFFLERGWRLHEVQTKDTIPMFADWVRRQIDTATLEEAIQIAEAHLDRRPWGITYYGRVLEDVLIGRERYLQTNRSERDEAHQRTHRKPESTAELHARLCEGAFGFGG